MLTTISIALGFLSAACWLRAATVKVSHAKATQKRKSRAQKRNEAPNLASVSFNGSDVEFSFRAQSFWNATAAILAALAMTAQSLSLISVHGT
jgi:hypothetical protein